MQLQVTLLDSVRLLQDNIGIHVVLLAIIADIFTGLGKSVKEKTLNSSIGLNGLIRHMIILFLVIVSTVYLTAYQLGTYSNFINMYFIIMYVISLFENLEAIGVNLPPWIVNYVTKMQSNMNEEFKISSSEKIDIKIEKKEK